MSFLSPWFLLGALAVAGPIVFHLIRRAARERTPFSSLMFLRPTPPRVTRRRKLEHLWLLLLRCLCLVLLATAFARPFVSRDNLLPAPAAEARQWLLLVDTSASMRRAGLWDQARALVNRYLDRATPADRVAVMTFDRQPRTLMSFADWSSWAPDERVALARQRLATVAPGWMGTQLGLALTRAAEQFADEPAAGAPASRREVLLITDLQEGCRLDGLQGHDWPAGVKVIVERVDTKRRTNAGLEIAEEIAPGATGESAVRVRVTNARDSGREKFRLNWRAESGGVPPGEPLEVYVPPGQSRVVKAPEFPVASPAGILQLTGDEEDFDNLAYYVAPGVEHLTVVAFGSAATNDPAQLRYYLERVFPSTPRRQVRVVQPDANLSSLPALLHPAALAVIPAPLGADEIQVVRDWVAGGKTALVVLTGVRMSVTLATLAGVPELPVTEANGDYALLGSIDFTHPLFAPFADPRFSDFSQIHFWRHRLWEIPPSVNARVLAKFDDGSPALAQIPVGQGNLLVLASGWNPADSQLAVSSKFLPLMQILLEWSIGHSATRAQFRTGDAIPSPTLSGDTVQWRKPDRTTETLAAGAPFTDTDQPGIYAAVVGNREHRFAVNLPLDESRTAPRSPDELAQLGVPLETVAQFASAPAEQRRRQFQQAELENRQKLWRWLILGALGVTLAEILLSGWLARRVKTVEVGP
jgi:hypothetical protein